MLFTIAFVCESTTARGSSEGIRLAGVCGAKLLLEVGEIGLRFVSCRRMVLSCDARRTTTTRSQKVLNLLSANQIV